MMQLDTPCWLNYSRRWLDLWRSIGVLGADKVHRSPPGCSLWPNWKGWLLHFQPPSFFSELHNIRVIIKTLIPDIRNWRQRELAVTGISQAMTHLLSVDQDPHKHEHWPTRRFFVSSRLFPRLPTSRQEHKQVSLEIGGCISSLREFRRMQQQTLLRSVPTRRSYNPRTQPE